MLHNYIISIIGAVALLLAYFFSVTLVGTAEAYTAHLAGDDTPAEEGFLSLNPLNYIDIFGFLCTVLVGFGWGRNVPFNPYNIMGRHKSFKAFLVYMAQPFFSLLLALIALILCVFLVGPTILSYSLAYNSIGNGMFVSKGAFYHLTHAYTDRSSIILATVIILLSLITLNTFIATWSLINNSFHYILFIGAEHGYDYMKHAEALAFFGPLVVLILFTGPLRFMLLNTTTYLAYFIAYLFGVCS